MRESDRESDRERVTEGGREREREREGEREREREKEREVFWYIFQSREHRHTFVRPDNSGRSRFCPGDTLISAYMVPDYGGLSLDYYGR